MVDVFISYATPDRERVRPIVTLLEREGWSVWWDRQIGAGSAFDREIEKAIDDARCIVVVWSPSSVESEWVRNEASEGLERGILVPVVIEDIRVPLAFRRIQTIDARADSFEIELFNAVEEFAPRLSKVGGDQTPYVGRANEKERLEKLLMRARSGEGSAVLVSGEAGVGKSRLATEIANSAARQRFLVLKGSCFDAESSPPFEPFIAQLETLFRTFDEATLKELIGGNALELSHLLPELTRLFPELSESIEIPAEHERRYLLNGISEFLARLSIRQPLLLVFDDLHWADESTCVMFRQLLSRVAESAIVVLGTYRDDELDSGPVFARTLRDLLRGRMADDILLTRLGETGVADFLEARAGKVPPRELVNLIFRETEGNPFFIEEVYRHLEETGKLFDETLQFRSGIEVADTEVPRGLRLVIGDRLDRASELCRKALSSAAVIGREFGFELLLDVSGINDDALVDAMDEAIGLSAIEDLSTQREARYGFVHEQIRQTLLSNLPVPRRQRMHLKVAESLESKSADRYVSEIAHHIYQAGAAVDALKTVEYLQRAGDKALDSLAFENAISTFDMALAVLDDEEPEKRAVLVGKKAKALRGAGNIDDAIAAFKEGLVLSKKGPVYEQLLFEKSLAEVDYFMGIPSVEGLVELLQLALARGDKQKELEIRFILARANYVVALDDGSHADETAKAYDEAIALARELDDKITLARLLTGSVQLRDFGQDFATSRNRASEAQAIARDLGDRVLELETLSMLGRVPDSGRSPEDLFSGAWELKELLEARRDPVRLNEHYFRLILICWRGGYHEQGVEVANDAIELSDRMGWLPVQYPTFKGFNLLSLGRVDEAFQSISEEVIDEDHRFAAAFQQFGYARYYMVLNANDRCFETLEPLNEELLSLGRTGARDMITQQLGALYARFAGDPARQAAVQSAIDESGLALTGRGNALYLLGKGDVEAAYEHGKSLMQATNALELYIQNVEGFLTILEARQSWDELVDYATPVLDPIEKTGNVSARWRVLALRGKAHRALGNHRGAEADFSRATADFRFIAERIPQQDVRAAFEADPLAQVLEVSA